MASSVAVSNPVGDESSAEVRALDVRTPGDDSANMCACVRGMREPAEGSESQSRSTPAFSVIIPSYMRFELLWEAIGSVLDQTVDDLEVLVVDDASPQPTRVPNDPRIRLLRREVNGTPAAARNTGLVAARGLYVTFMDDDDLYAPDRLANGLRGMAQGADIALSWMQPVGGVRNRRVWRKYLRNENRILEGNVHDVILDGIRPHLGQITIRREMAPLFDERFIHAEDLEWWLRASRRARVATVPQVGYLLRNHDGPQFSRNLADRIGYKFLLLQVHDEYFRSHPRAAAQQWAGIGKLAGWVGDRRLARQALRRAVGLDPTLAVLRRLVGSIRPSGSVFVHRIPEAVEVGWLERNAGDLNWSHEFASEDAFRYAHGR